MFWRPSDEMLLGCLKDWVTPWGRTEEVAAVGGVHVFTEQEGWDVLEDIPNDSAAALILLQHQWAVPLRDAIVRAESFRISDGFISPLDLVEMGLLSAEEAQELYDPETSAAASTP
jgi:hypothetical protein